MSATQQGASSRKALEKMLPTLVHALRTPLSGLAMGIEIAAMRLQRHNDDANFLEPMRQTLHDMSGTLDQLARFVRHTPPKIMQVDAPRYLTEIVRAWGWAHPKAQVLWSDILETPPWTPLALDIDAVPQAVGHLLDNAFEAGGLVPIRVALSRPDHRSVCLSVRDAGPKIEADVIARMREPFYTTKHRQLGLGLAFAQRVAEGHRGRIAVNSSAVGTQIDMHLTSLEDMLAPTPTSRPNVAD